MNKLKFIWILLLVSCGGNHLSEEEMENIEFDKEISKAFVEQCDRDNVYIDSLNVKRDREKSGNLTIYWSPNVYPHRGIIVQYSEIILASLKDEEINSIDSLNLEVDTPDLPVIRFKADRSNLFEIKDSYSNIDEEYPKLISFILANEYVDGLEYLDYFMRQYNELSPFDKIDWMDEGFLAYSFRFLQSKEDSVQFNNEMEIMNSFFYDAPWGYNAESPKEIINFLLKSADQEAFVYSIGDTSKYGNKPQWLLDEVVR